MAYVIAALNQKGGVGKSILATNIATAYARRSKKALLADADSQGTAHNWRGTGPNSDESERSFPDVVGAKLKIAMRLDPMKRSRSSRMLLGSVAGASSTGSFLNRTSR